MSTARKSSQEKKPCESIAKSKPTRGSAKTPSISGHKSAARVLSTEVIPSKGDHSKSHNKAKDGSKREASPSSNQQPLDPSSAADTTAYWNAHLQAKFGKQKKAVVDKFMAIIAECIDRKLEPFEEPCDGEGCNPSSSSSRASPKSSACKKGEISSKIQSIGKKRRPCQRDDDEDSGDDQDEGDDRRNDNNKRSKTIPEAKLMYACPYYKYAPDIFGQKRTCMGPGWYELHRLKEHLNRCHKLPEFSCARCLESFAKENLLVKHQRADKACRIKEAPRNTARNLADGFNKEQADQLKKARNGPGHEKWMGWYCILFEEEDPKSPHLPSPYMGVSGGTTWREGHTSNSKYGPYLDAWRRHVLNVVRSLFETELDRKLQGLQPEIRSHVLARIPSVAESVQRIFQTDPEYSEMCKGEGHDKASFVMPPGLDPSQLFDSVTFLDGFDSATFAQSDGFDWNLLNNDEPNLGQIYQPGSDYSSSYVSDDLNGTSQSSNTSVEDYYNGTNKVQGMQQTLALPQQSTLPHDNPYAQGYFQ